LTDLEIVLEIGCPPLYQHVYLWLQEAPWKDVRHRQTLAWMLVGLLSTMEVALTRWCPFVVSRAELAQSTQRRFERWLYHRRISTLHLYAALIKGVLADFQDRTVYLALDTTLLWNTYCVVYVSLVYRGRMIPLAWKVMEHDSASIAFRDYRSLLVFLKRQLVGKKGRLLADRGFVHRDLMRWVKHTANWHFRLRYKSGIGLYYWTGGHFLPLSYRVSPGRVVCYHGVYVTGQFEKVHLVVGWQRGAEEPWILLSDETTWPETLAEYALRFDIEEGFLDQKSNGFQWESSRLRDRHALRRLCLVMAIATLILISQGSQVVAEGQRRRVDPHWFRGHSYARIGADWIRRALARGLPLMSRLTLTTAVDPEPARASRKQPESTAWIRKLPWHIQLLQDAPWEAFAGM
jgi:hypothetical protein